MKNVKLLLFSALLLTMYAFQCEETCDVVDKGTAEMDIELSSTASSFIIGDELTFSTSFLSDLGGNEVDYNLEGQSVRYDFELFVFNENNEPLEAPIDEIEIISDNVEFFPSDIPKTLNTFIFQCEVDCTFDITLSLKEKGYYGLFFKNGWFDSQRDCIDIVINAEKEPINNIDILEELDPSPVTNLSLAFPTISEKNSFFFKVE